MHLTIKDTTMSFAVRNFNIGMANYSELPKILDFLQEHYVPHSYFWKYAHLDNDEEAIENLKKFCRIALSQNISVIATDESGEIIGFACNIVVHKELPVDCGQDGNKDAIKAFIKEVGKEIYIKHEDIAHYFYIALLGVRPDYNNVGLEKRLVNYSRIIAADYGLAIIRLDSHTASEANIAKKIGFTLVNEIKYNEYKPKDEDEDEEPIFSEESKDEVFSVFAIKSKRPLFKCLK